MPITARLKAAYWAIIALGASTLLQHACYAHRLLPNKLQLRHDLTLLADAGLIQGPITTWPLAVSTDLHSLPESTPAHLSDAAFRVRAAMAQEGSWVGASAAHEPIALRSFADAPRSDGEVAVGYRWSGERAYANLHLAALADPEDGDELRPDGSYAGLYLGNWALSAGWTPRWWGPGYSGSLILSTNARPVPALSVDRVAPEAFQTPWLSWLGPWDFSVFLGQLEDDRVVPDALLFGMRLSLRPLQRLEIGLSRTAQWGGEGRPEDFDTFLDMLRGKDNVGAQLAADDEPGNQLAGIDFRWSRPLADAPFALYGQVIGEDEADYLPSANFWLIGTEAWGATGNGTWRAYAEYADTTAGSFFSDERPNTAYNHHTYQTGYRYEGRPMGYPTDGDSRLVSLGGLLSLPSGSYSLLLQLGELNRVGNDSRHSLSPATATEVQRLTAGYDWTNSWGEWRLAGGVSRYAPDNADAETEPHGYISWQYFL